MGYLLRQWFYQWWYVLGQRIKVFLGYKSDCSCLRLTCLHSLRTFSPTERYHPSPSNVWQFASQRNQSTVITNAITDVQPESAVTLTNNRLVSQTVFNTVHDYGIEYCKMTSMLLILTTDQQFLGEIYQDQSFMRKLHAQLAFLKVRAATIMAFLNYFQDQVPHVTQAHPKMERLLHNLQANTSLEEDLLFCSEQGYNFTCPDKNWFASSVQPSLLHIPNCRGISRRSRDSFKVCQSDSIAGSKKS